MDGFVIEGLRRRGMQETIFADAGARGHAELLRMHIAKFVQLASLTMRRTLP
ncbi:hypothetical protein [Bradyrhizobium sp. CCBAU 51753]|uniref:hypothetical protein n=1 Tax=Bradyrhizobium sp. CCBAU 51753 TaxID=1325100 RepID=UPI00188B7571|nr:hypothetical protein [Bradyrhizobium sp. CCBAU 51753]